MALVIILNISLAIIICEAVPGNFNYNYFLTFLNKTPSIKNI